MSQPPGYVHSDYPNYLCKLNKSLYGLPQAPRAWFSRLTNFLLRLGFVASNADTSLYMPHKANLQLFFLIYVDDIIITGSAE